MAEQDLIDTKACESLAKMGYLNVRETHMNVTEKGAPLLEALLADLVSDTLVSP
jgi:ribosomal protein S19E (S16A)